MASRKAEIEPELCKITPKDAHEWLKGNRSNRPVRHSHVRFLAGQIKAGKWLVNGETIKISDDDVVLDGQHRLMAVIQADAAIETWVMYGISRDAMCTIDTGVVRTAADVVGFSFDGKPTPLVKPVATAARWCRIIEAGFVRNNDKLTNAEVAAYVKAHPSLWVHAEIVNGFPKMARPISVGCGTGLLEIIQRKDEKQAHQFVKDVFTGELLSSDSPAYRLRALLLKDADRTAKYPEEIRMKMCVKAWNLTRRGMKATTHGQGITVSAKDDKIKVL